MFSKLSDNKKIRRVVEFVIVLAIIAVCIKTVYNHYKRLEFYAKKVVCESDARNFNYAVKIFKLKYGRLPRSLQELKKKKLLRIKSTPIISSRSKFRKNKVIDPFGNPYIFDNITGEVYLSEKSSELIKNKNR